MARSSVTTQQIVFSGLSPAMSSPNADGDVIDSGAVALMVVNNDTVAQNVTLRTPVMVDGLEVEQNVVSVAAGQQILIGPLPKRTYGRTSGADVGRVYVDYAGTASNWSRAVVSF